MFQNFNYDKNELKKLHITYIQAKACYETIHELEMDCDKRVLESHLFYESEKWVKLRISRGGDGKRKRILNPEDSDLMDEDDAQEYYTFIYEEYKKEGIDHPKGRCYIPSAPAKDLLHQAENLLLDYAISIAPEEMRGSLEAAKFHWKYREQLLDLALKLDCGKIEKEDVAV